MKPYGTGHMGGAQYTTISGQINVAHNPPSVRILSILTIRNNNFAFTNPLNIVNSYT